MQPALAIKALCITETCKKNEAEYSKSKLLKLILQQKRQKEAMKMSNISELDLQNLRHLIGGFDTTHCKMQAYAKEATDPQVRQFFEKGAKSAMDNKQQLMKFLG